MLLDSVLLKIFKVFFLFYSCKLTALISFPVISCVFTSSVVTEIRVVESPGEKFPLPREKNSNYNSSLQTTNSVDSFSQCTCSCLLLWIPSLLLGF